MFEDRTYENILQETLEQAPEGVDVRQGSIFYDAVAGACFKIASYYADLQAAFALVFLTTAVGEYLDDKGVECGLERNPATTALYTFIYDGVEPDIGTRFFAQSAYFVLTLVDNQLCLEAESAGISYNNIPEGEPAVPVETVQGLRKASFGKMIEPGTDAEDDEHYRQRIREKLSGPAENGNRQHYKTWCEEVEGVGRARIIPLWAGENTVKGVIFGVDGLPAASTVIERVQEYIDPGSSGLGNGTANIGAHFTAVAAEAISVAISFAVTLKDGYTIEDAKTQAEERIAVYFQELALGTPESETVVVRVSTIGALLAALPALLDYSRLTLNGKIENISIGNTQVAVLEGVALLENV